MFDQPGQEVSMSAPKVPEKTLVLHLLYDGCSQAAGVVLQLPPAGGAVQHPGPAALTHDVSGWTAGDGQVPGDHQTHRALHYRLQVRPIITTF